MKRLACALAVISLTMVGCGGSLCDDVADASKDWNSKVKDCPNLSAVTFEEPTESELKQCEDNLDSCSDADKKIFNTFVDCINALPKCTASTEEAFANSALGCFAPTQNVSNTCGPTGNSLPRNVEALFSSQR